MLDQSGLVPRQRHTMNSVFGVNVVQPHTPMTDIKESRVDPSDSISIADALIRDESKHAERLFAVMAKFKKTQTPGDSMNPSVEPKDLAMFDTSTRGLQVHGLSRNHTPNVDKCTFETKSIIKPESHAREKSTRHRRKRANVPHNMESDDHINPHHDNCACGAAMRSIPIMATGTSEALAYIPIAAAASAVGLPKAVVQRWVSDGQVACIRPQANNSHRLVDVKDLRQFVQQKRQSGATASSTTSSKRLLVYARVDPVQNDQQVMGSVEENTDADARVQRQCQKVAVAAGLESGKFLWGGEAADVADWSNRLAFGQLMDKILAREINTIVVLTRDRLAQGTALELLEWLCRRNHVDIVCADLAPHAA